MRRLLAVRRGARQEHVVDRHDASLPEQRDDELELARVVALPGVEEREVERALELCEPLRSIPQPQVGPLADTRSLEVPARGLVALGVDLERDDGAAGGERAGDVERRDADR